MHRKKFVHTKLKCKGCERNDSLQQWHRNLRLQRLGQALAPDRPGQRHPRHRYPQVTRGGRSGRYGGFTPRRRRPAGDTNNTGDALSLTKSRSSGRPLMG